MQVAFISVDRDPPYILDSFRSIRESGYFGEVDIFVGSPSREYLSLLTRKAYIREMTPKMWERIEPMSAVQRAAGNFLQALRSEPDKSILLLEDDVCFKPGWYPALQEAILETPDNSFISLYSARELKQKPLTKLEKPIHFYGTCGFFVPLTRRKQLADYVDKSLFPGGPSFDDLAVKFINETKNTGLYVTVPSYVDHIGSVSSIPSNRNHGPRKSPIF